MSDECRPDASALANAEIAWYIEVARGAHRRAFQQYARAASAGYPDPEQVQVARRGLRFQRLYLASLLLLSDELSGETVVDFRGSLRVRMESVAAIEWGWVAKS